MLLIERRSLHILPRLAASLDTKIYIWVPFIISPNVFSNDHSILFERKWLGPPQTWPFFSLTRDLPFVRDRLRSRHLWGYIKKC